MATNAIRPKLAVADASAAIGFYQRTLGAHVVATYPIGDTIVFAEVEVLGCSVTLKDADETDPVTVPGPILDVVVDDPDGLAAKMVDGGAEVIFPVDDQPYGARGGRVRDPFGVQWLLQTPVTVSPEEWPAVLDRMTSSD